MILHITNDYTGSKIYQNLFFELDKLGTGQIIYTALREEDKIGENNLVFNHSESKIVYSKIINYTIDRLFYRYKIYKIFKDIERKVDLTKIKLIHAHTWYSDGGVAYLINKKYKIPYITAIRSTDIHVFFKYLIHERKFGLKILENTNNIILISTSYKKKLKELNYNPSTLDRILKKTLVIPNGVDNFWIMNSQKKKNNSETYSFNLLYVGRFIERKHLWELQNAVLNLENNYKYNIRLHIVGDGDKYKRKIMKLCEEFPNLFINHGKIYDKQSLLKIFQACDIFAMPSTRETFGLVYVEALLQDLPILYTNDDGIDGFYSENIGEKVLGFSVSEIENKLLLMFKNFKKYDIPLNKIKENHNWSKIAKRYLKLYFQ